MIRGRKKLYVTDLVAIEPYGQSPRVLRPTAILGTAGFASSN